MRVYKDQILTLLLDKCVNVKYKSLNHCKVECSFPFICHRVSSWYIFGSILSWRCPDW